MPHEVSTEAPNLIEVKEGEGVVDKEPTILDEVAKMSKEEQPFDPTKFECKWVPIVKSRVQVKGEDGQVTTVPHKVVYQYSIVPKEG